MHNIVTRKLSVMRKFIKSDVLLRLNSWRYADETNYFYCFWLGTSNMWNRDLCNMLRSAPRFTVRFLKALICMDVGKSVDWIRRTQSNCGGSLKWLSKLSEIYWQGLSTGNSHKINATWTEPVNLYWLSEDMALLLHIHQYTAAGQKGRETGR